MFEAIGCCLRQTLNFEDTGNEGIYQPCTFQCYVPLPLTQVTVGGGGDCKMSVAPIVGADSVTCKCLHVPGIDTHIVYYAAYIQRIYLRQVRSQSLRVVACLFAFLLCKFCTASDKRAGTGNEAISQSRKPDPLPSLAEVGLACETSYIRGILSKSKCSEGNLCARNTEHAQLRYEQLQ